MNSRIIDVLSEICGDEKVISTVVGSAPNHGTDFLRNAISVLKKKRYYRQTIGVDGGAKILLDLGYKPELFVGDCDSFVNASESECFVNTDNENVLIYPSEKDDTDMQLAVETAINNGAEKIILLCATNGRIDHFLGCFQLLEYFGESNDFRADLIIADEQNVLFYIPYDEDCIEFHMTNGLYFSIIPVSSEIEGLTIEGAKYLLDNYDLNRGASRCISNCLNDDMTDGRVKVSKKSGSFVIVVSKDV